MVWEGFRDIVTRSPWVFMVAEIAGQFHRVRAGRMRGHACRAIVR
jgi:hypothetical protein